MTGWPQTSIDPTYECRAAGNTARAASYLPCMFGLTVAGRQTKRPQPGFGFTFSWDRQSARSRCELTGCHLSGLVNPPSGVLWSPPIHSAHKT